MAQSDKDLRLAVLIDADNAPRTALADIMAEVAVYGTPTMKRIYGDWTAPNMGSWKPLLLQHAITPIQQYGYTTGKNSTDSAMIIDAMDILYSGRVDGFVLVSSDSDFTRLAIRLREAGMKVYGMGEKKTPQPFIVACDRFIYIEVIRAARASAEEKPAALEKAAAQEQDAAGPQGPAPQEESAPAKPAKKSHKKKQPAPEPEPEYTDDHGVPAEIVQVIAESLDMVADEDGFAFLGTLGHLIQKKRPDFDSRNYGYSKLSQMMRAMDRFEVEDRQSEHSNDKHNYIRDKKRKQPPL